MSMSPPHSRRGSTSTLPSIRSLLPEVCFHGQPPHQHQQYHSHHDPRGYSAPLAPLSVPMSMPYAASRYPSPTSPRSNYARRDTAPPSAYPPSTAAPQVTPITSSALGRSRSPSASGRARRNSVRRTAPVPIGVAADDWTTRPSSPTSSTIRTRPNGPLPSPALSSASAVNGFNAFRVPVSPISAPTEPGPGVGRGIGRTRGSSISTGLAALDMRFYASPTQQSDAEGDAEDPSDGEDPEDDDGTAPPPTASSSSTSRGRRRKPEERKHKCGECEKLFSRPSSLRIHENTHTGNKPFECPQQGCGRTFSVNSNMRRHYRTHTPSDDTNASIITATFPPAPRGMPDSRSVANERQYPGMASHPPSAFPAVYQGAFGYGHGMVHDTPHRNGYRPGSSGSGSSGES